MTSSAAAQAETPGQESDIVSWRRPRAGTAGLLLVGLALGTGLATYLILTGLTPIEPTPRLVSTLVLLNGGLVLLLAILIGWQVWLLWQARRRRLAGARLHGRIVVLLFLFAAVPAVIVAIFASVTLNRGLDAWFSERIEAIVRRAIIVSEAYIQDKVETARLDAEALAREIAANRQLYERDPQLFMQRLSVLAAVRGLPAVYLINPAKRRLEAAVTVSDDIRFRPPPPDAYRVADSGRTLVTGPGPGDNFIRALKKLKGFDGLYVLVYRAVNPRVIQQLTAAREELSEFLTFKKQRFGLQITFAFVYAGVTLIFLLAAIWFGLWMADRLVQPVVGLIRAARELGRGNFDAPLPTPRGNDDIDVLVRVFGQMARQLKAQRAELLEAYHQLDERRRFTEAVLEGVSAGVIGLDAQGRISLVNRSAQELLKKPATELKGRALAEVLPPFAKVLRKARARRSGQAEDHVQMQIDGEERTFLVRITREHGGGGDVGYVLTFDDTTELLTAQRNAAWADVARRIAHEIKNPLTPIQLSAERLKRRFGKEISSAPDVFTKCTDTIIRQVEDIGRMVDEFSSFARMPKAHMEQHDLVETVKEALLLQRLAGEDIDIVLDLPEGPLPALFDRRLITQAITNLVKNAREAIEARIARESEPKGRIEVRLEMMDGEAAIRVIDNGCGLPREQRGRLTEPYMTTREKGTGLGLAIVQRIMEEHHGRLELADNPAGQGAMVSLVLPLGSGAAAARGKDEEETATTENDEA